MKNLRPSWVCGYLGWAAAVGLLVAGGILRLTMLPAIPLVEWDSAGWLEPALSWATGGPFRETAEREWLYAAFLAGVIKGFGSLEAIVWVQWAIGLTTGAILFSAWRAWLGLLAGSWLTELTGTLLGLGLLASFILNIDFVVFEMSVRPESLLGLTLAGVLLASARFVSARWKDKSPRQALLWGTLLPVLGAAIVTLKPSWALGIPVMGLPLLAACFGPKSDWLRHAAPLLTGCLLAVLLVLLPEKIFFIKSGEPRVVLPMTLFTIHTDAVLEAFQKEAADPSTPAERTEFLRSILPLLEDDYRVAVSEPYNYVRLGFDPDYVMYRGRLFPHMAGAMGFSRAELAAFCTDSYRIAWIRAPQKILEKIRIQLGYFFAPDERTYTKSRMDIGKMTEGSRSVAPRDLDERFPEAARAIFARFRAALDGAPTESRELRAWKPLHQFLKKSVPPNYLFLTAAVLACALCLGLRPLRPLVPAALTALYFFGLGFGNALTISIVHAMDNDRYRISYGPIVLFAMGAAVILLIAMAERYAMARLPSRPANP